MPVEPEATTALRQAAVEAVEFLLDAPDLPGKSWVSDERKNVAANLRKALEG